VSLKTRWILWVASEITSRYCAGNQMWQPSYNALPIACGVGHVVTSHLAPCHILFCDCCWSCYIICALLYVCSHGVLSYYMYVQWESILHSLRADLLAPCSTATLWARVQKGLSLLQALTAFTFIVIYGFCVVTVIYTAIFI
jgi:hypothetical protein